MSIPEWEAEGAQRLALMSSRVCACGQEKTPGWFECLTCHDVCGWDDSVAFIYENARSPLSAGPQRGGSFGEEVWSRFTKDCVGGDSGPPSRRRRWKP